MRNKTGAFGVKIIIIVHLLGLALFGAQTIEISQKQQKDLGVKCQAVVQVETTSFGPYNGVVSLDKRDILLVSSNVASIVQDIYVRKLEYVKQGQKLLTLKSNGLLSLQQEYLEALLESKNINQNHERNIKLFADGIISNKKLLESQKLKQSSDLMLTSKANQLLTNNFSLAMLQELKKKNQPIVEKTMYASRDGIVNEVNVNIGEYVQAEDKMIEIYADGTRFIQLTFPVKVVKNVSIGDICTFDSYSAKVSAIGNVVNSASQSVEVRAIIENAKDIMINRVYEVTLIDAISGAFKVTKNALVFDENKPYLFKKVSLGFEMIEVKIISEGDNCYIVKGDLGAGDEVAASSTSALLSARESKSE
ncbi:MAG: efflux RND transporter periplasmic adaptor subunit [Campylobacterales bacterium]|nr:efflux RND transporter periplasmic adaptor subunit [Campylobacterales bacterium]